MIGEGSAAAGALLALDTSGPVGSVAVAIGRSVVARASLERRAEHAARLLPTIDRLLTEGGVEPRALAGIVVGAGPGSFTGVRVAAATAKGLTHALDIPLWAVSSLAAAALASGAGAECRYVLVDARADRVYGACYRVGEASFATVVAPHAGTLDEALARDVPEGTIFTGDGAVRHRAVIERAGHMVRERGEESLAEGLVRYLSLCPDAAALADVGAWEPAYMRDSVAVPS